MNQHLQLEDKLLWLFGKSGSGKTSFFKEVLLPRWSNGEIYIFTKDTAEWTATPTINILPKDFNIQNISTLPENSLIFFDDFSKSCSDKHFQEIVNFNLRHEKKTLIISVHDTFKSGLFTDLCQASRFFLTYSPSSLKLLQVLDKQYNTNFKTKFQTNYSKGVAHHHVAFLNSDTQIFIPNFTLTAPTEMFMFDDTKLILHPSDQTCGQSLTTTTSTDTEEEVPLFLYPKWEKKGRYVLKAIQAFLDKNNYLKGKI